MSGTLVVVCVTVSSVTQQQRVLAASFVKSDTRLSRGQLLGSLINRDKITSHAAPTPLRPPPARVTSRFAASEALHAGSGSWDDGVAIPNGSNSVDRSARATPRSGTNRSKRQTSASRARTCNRVKDAARRHGISHEEREEMEDCDEHEQHDDG